MQLRDSGGAPLWYVQRHCWASLVAQTVKRLPAMRETWDRSQGREDPLEKEMATHSSILPGKSHGRRSMVGYSPWGRRELDMTERLQILVILISHICFLPCMTTATILVQVITSYFRTIKISLLPLILSPRLGY